MKADTNIVCNGTLYYIYIFQNTSLYDYLIHFVIYDANMHFKFKIQSS